MIDKEIIKLRHKLHSKPELSNIEFETARIIKDFIKEHGPTRIVENIGGAGLAAVYEYPNEGKTITIRCELDALPIKEDNQIPYKSTREGVSHKCGHDGHMAIVASLALWLKSKALSRGKVILLFQPAEETGQGAQRIISDEKYRALRTDYVFALHNIPKEPMHSIILMSKGFSAEVQSLIIKLEGKESHAAEPEHGINPALPMSEMIKLIADLNEINPEDESFAVLTPVHINMGRKSYGISPGRGELHYTIRTWSAENMQIIKAEIVQVVKEVSERHKLKFAFDWLEYFPASINDGRSNDFVWAASKKNKFEIIERKYPFKFGEDFGWYSREYKTSMFGIGAGLTTPALHNADYDFPDELLTTGFSMFKSIISQVLKEA